MLPAAAPPRYAGRAMLPALAQALPVFAIIALGFFAGRANLIAGDQAQALNRFVFLFAMPAALFIFAATNPPPGLADLPFTGVYLGVAVGIFFVSPIMARTLFGLSLREAGAHAFGSTLGNAVFLGLPIVLTIEGWGAPYLLLMLCEGIVIIALGAAFITAPEDGQTGVSLKAGADALRRVARNPIVLAMILGFLVAMLRLPVPEPAENFFRLLGRAAGPAALFALGVSLAVAPRGPVAERAGRLTAITLMKLIAMPGLTWLGMILIGATPEQTGAAVLFTSMPTAVAVFVQTAHERVYQNTIAAAITVTTLLSLLSVTLVLALFNA